MEAEKLLTRLDPLTGIYKPNDYWISKLNITNDSIKHYLNLSLAKFSQQFDQIVNEISNEWIQIKTKVSDEKGLFDFTLYAFDLPDISKRITHETTFDEFLDLMFVIFNQLLKLNLNVIRNKLEKEAKSRVNELINDLQINIDKIANFIDAGELNKAIRIVRTEMQIAFDRIIEWFHLSRSTSNEPFLIEDAINISIEMVKTYSEDFKINIKKPINKAIIFQGKYLTSFVDILFIIFENIVRHSGVKKGIEANVSITCEYEYIYFYIDNKIDKNVENDVTRKRINSIKVAMAERRYMQSIRREGELVFIKLGKLLIMIF
jgi:hypothetical protein